MEPDRAVGLDRPVGVADAGGADVRAHQDAPVHALVAPRGHEELARADRAQKFEGLGVVQRVADQLEVGADGGISVAGVAELGVLHVAVEAGSDPAPEDGRIVDVGPEDPDHGHAPPRQLVDAAGPVEPLAQLL